MLPDTVHHGPQYNSASICICGEKVCYRFVWQSDDGSLAGHAVGIQSAMKE